MRAAAELAGVTPGAPADVYPPATSVEPDRPLAIDASSARRLARWFDLTATALEALRADHADDDPSVTQLSPEHFDLATTIAEVNYGGSPGDDGHAHPYLYVGPFDPPAPDGGFWNEPFGASIGAVRVSDADDALAYFRRGRQHAETVRSTNEG